MIPKIYSFLNGDIFPATMLAGFGTVGLIRGWDAETAFWWIANPFLWAIAGLFVAMFIAVVFEKVFIR